RMEEADVFPAKHFVLPEERVGNALVKIRKELAQQLEKFKDEGKLLEAQRLSARTRYDIEMLQQVGYCPGVENYSQPLSGREPGTPPDTLFSFFPEDYLLFVDESHVTVPQIRGMQTADRNRKKTLIEHGFRLPSSLDNRPLTFAEWEERVNQVIYVSATPGPYELEKTGGKYIEQVIRPTGLLDPVIEVIPATECKAGESPVSPIASPGQVPHLLEQVKERAAKGERVLVTTLTKRLAEDLSAYFLKKNVRCKWLHSELDAFERVELLRELRQGEFDVLVGVNLLREGLDLPEVSLVAILDADKEGFLRSETSLMQTIGRSARNVNAKVLLYADKMTEAMRHAIDETARRRQMQNEFNQAHGITPQTIRKNIDLGIEKEAEAYRRANAAVGRKSEEEIVTQEFIAELEAEMMEAAGKLEFERAAAIRDRLEALKKSVGKPVSEVKPEKRPRGRRRSH
ncbi:MAG: UvrB/UvrC motif-containing protein, partial [Thermoguttaceae bacterium]|nr:UvrB/UvrC motif-containing protein [Thermoguttaceae bacterium]